MTQQATLTTRPAAMQRSTYELLGEAKNRERMFADYRRNDREVKAIWHGFRCTPGDSGIS
jgi:hypothetical protein